MNERVIKEVGDGAIDIPALLRAAAKVGVNHYFVEQDQTPGDAVKSLRIWHMPSKPRPVSGGADSPAYEVSDRCSHLTRYRWELTPP